MSAIRKAIAVIDQEDSWIKAQVTAGEFTDDNGYIRDLVCHDQVCNAEIGTICAVLIGAKESGAPQLFDRKLLKQKMKTRHG